MDIPDKKILTSLYDWLESIPFSKPKKNFARDFSDGVFVAELIKYYFPTLVELHNYPALNSFEQKKTNWSILNQRVLRKLDFPISDATISELASGSKRDATEYFLYTLKQKIEAKKMFEKMKKKPDSSQDMERFYDTLDVPVEGTKNDANEVTEKFETCLTALNKVDNTGDSNLDVVPREVYDQKVQEVLACEETIQVLKARIQRLENLLKLKNVRIARQQQVLEKLKVAQNTAIVQENLT